MTTGEPNSQALLARIELLEAELARRSLPNNHTESHTGKSSYFRVAP